MSIAFVLLNSDIGSDDSIISQIKDILKLENEFVFDL